MVKEIKKRKKKSNKTKKEMKGGGSTDGSFGTLMDNTFFL